MANVLDRNFDFATNGTVTAAGLHNLIDETNIYAGLISTQEEKTTVGTSDLLLVADSSSIGSPQIAANRTTVYNLFDDALSAGTYTGLNLSGALTYGTATGNRTVSTSATITTGTIPNLTSSTANITLGTIASLNSTAGTIATLNSTTGTIAGLNSTNGTIASLNSTAGTIASLNSTAGTIATLNSTTGTITNLSTTLAGDFTISQGTGTLGTTAVTAGSYGSVSAIPFITVDAKGRVTNATTGTFSSTPADGSVTPAKLSQPFTIGTAVVTTSGTAVNFTGIPSWARMITVIFNAVSIADGGDYLVRIGSGTTSSTGYVSTSINNGTGGADGVSSTTGFIARMGNAPDSLSGIMHIVSVSGNTWVSSHRFKRSTSNIIGGGGDCTISGALDRVQITNTTSTTFDSGSVNIIYQG